MVIKEEVEKAQFQWAGFLIKASSLRDNYEFCVREVESQICRLYAFDRGPVLFKPTFAKEQPFRTDLEGALSYFVGKNGKYSEDQGFALKNWKGIRFENASMILEKELAFAMGHYFFLEGTKEQEIKVEFTFGYLRDLQGSLRICLHHSSLP